MNFERDEAINETTSVTQIEDLINHDNGAQFTGRICEMKNFSRCFINFKIKNISYGQFSEKLVSCCIQL